jgi:hypothetical protein
MKRQEKVSADILKIIRNRSETGRLANAEEILSELRCQGLLDSQEFEQKTWLETTLKQVLRENQDIREISANNEIDYYYSVRSLSETYARILALKSDNPLRLIAEIVRENSRLYPRPVSATSFREPPFGLTEEEITECLATMVDREEYQDIAQTITSVGTKFVYSSRYLDPDYASLLAEWLDVGQADNP